MIKQFERFQGCGNKQRIYRNVRKGPGSSKRSMFNIDEIVWCDTFNAWCALVCIKRPFLRKPQTPPPQTSHEAISFPVYNGNLQLVDIHAVKCWYKRYSVIIQYGIHYKKKKKSQTRHSKKV